jgi:hypothetical protein
MARSSLQTAGVFLITVPAVEFGGVTLLRLPPPPSRTSDAPIDRAKS